MPGTVPRPDSPNMDPMRRSFRDLQNVIKHRPSLVNFVQWLTAEEMRFAPDTLMTGNKIHVAKVAGMRATQTAIQLIDCEDRAPSLWPATPREVGDYIELSNQWYTEVYPWETGDSVDPREHLKGIVESLKVDDLNG